MKRQEHQVRWPILLFYGFVSLLVLLVAGVATRSFFERQSVARSVAAESLPPITIITRDTPSPRAAAWVDLLSRADFAPTLITAENFRPTNSVIAICDLDVIPPLLAKALDQHLRSGHGIALLGAAPRGLPADITTTSTTSSGVIRFSDATSPILARVNPGHELGAKAGVVAAIEESPSMSVDARWSGDARPAIAHFQMTGGRLLFFGLDPAALYFAEDRQLALLLRTAFRWVAGQPVSEGAIGELAQAKAMAPAARMAARQQRMTFSVDRLEKAGQMSLRVVNRGSKPLSNPTVKIWLPARARSIALGGDWVARRGVTLTPIPEDQSVVIALAKLDPGEQKLLKLRAR